MLCYTPKRKTTSGVEDVKLPITAINGLAEELTDLDNKTLAMPRIRLAAVSDSDNTMVISSSNPLKFTIEIIDGVLQIGDEVQICTRQLFTYHDKKKRKYKLRNQWCTRITEENVNNRFIYVTIDDSVSSYNQRLYKTGATGTFTLSPLYIRVRRPIYAGTTDVDGYFSNIITVWKKYDRGTGKVFIK